MFLGLPWLNTVLFGAKNRSTIIGRQNPLISNFVLTHGDALALFQWIWVGNKNIEYC